MIATPRAVLDFWFSELSPKQWFMKDPALDSSMAERFTGLHLALSRQVPDLWTETPEAWLALVIVFDQFPRNIYRGSPLAFATDGLALKEAKAAIASGADMAVSQAQRIFFYLPFEHAEDLTEQHRAVQLCEVLGDANYLDYARRHRDVITEFGRFPHRNAILRRDSTVEELAYLSKPGAGF